MECREWQGTTNDKDSDYGVRFLKEDGKWRKTFVHRWVVEQVEGRRLGRHEIVRHTCDNPRCFLYEHLVLGTQAENMRDMATKRRGNTVKLSWEDVRSMRERHESGESGASLARAFGLHHATAYRIISNQTWKEG